MDYTKAFADMDVKMNAVKAAIKDKIQKQQDNHMDNLKALHVGFTKMYYKKSNELLLKNQNTYETCMQAAAIKNGMDIPSNIIDITSDLLTDSDDDDDTTVSKISTNKAVNKIGTNKGIKTKPIRKLAKSKLDSDSDEPESPVKK